MKSLEITYNIVLQIREKTLQLWKWPKISFRDFLKRNSSWIQILFTWFWQYSLFEHVIILIYNNLSQLWPLPVQKLPNLFPSSDPGQIGFSTCGRRGAHGLARVGTTSDYDRQDYFHILCYGRGIVVNILKIKCQKQKIHGEFGSTELLVRFLISAL